jgi:hypothetical protein
MLNLLTIILSSTNLFGCVFLKNYPMRKWNIATWSTMLVGSVGVNISPSFVVLQALSSLLATTMYLSWLAWYFRVSK